MQIYKTNFSITKRNKLLKIEEEKLEYSQKNQEKRKEADPKKMLHPQTPHLNLNLMVLHKQNTIQLALHIHLPVCISQFLFLFLREIFYGQGGFIRSCGKDLRQSPV